MYAFIVLVLFWFTCTCTMFTLQWLLFVLQSSGAVCTGRWAWALIPSTLPSLISLIVYVDVKPVLNWAHVCSPNILRTLRLTMIRFLIELLVRRIRFGQSKLYFILNWLVMRCKLRPELAADAQQTAWSKMEAKVKSIYFHHPSQGNSTNYYLILGLRDEAAPPTSQKISSHRILCSRHWAIN